MLKEGAEHLTAFCGKPGTYARFTQGADCEIALRGFMASKHGRGRYRVDRTSDGLAFSISGTPPLVRIAAAFVAGWNRRNISLAASEETENKRLRDTLERIATAYLSVAGPNDCQPSPHACDKCEIYFLLAEVLGPRP